MYDGALFLGKTCFNKYKGCGMKNKEVGVSHHSFIFHGKTLRLGKSHIVVTNPLCGPYIDEENILRIAKGCPENIPSVVNVSSCFY